jgi:diguanylate cyclase (GGDEF)-like protein
MSAPRSSRRIDSLERENRSLRREVEELRGYRALAYRDPLTGLRNRRYLDERLHEEIDRARRGSGPGLSVVVVDIDGFKAINDTYGHLAGDATLRWVARLLEENVRRSDVCCRLGGDEFVILLPGADAAECAALTERIRRRLAAAPAAEGPQISLSVGAATLGDQLTTADGLLGEADRAMYRVKRSLTPPVGLPARR